MTEILIVEDSRTQAARLKFLLERNHYKIFVALDGKEAISILSKLKPSLIISDIEMPNINGFELCRQIKANSTTRHIPVILLTSLTNKKDVLEGIECGADSFINKPYSNDFLISYVKQTITRSQKNNIQSKEISFETVIDGEKRVITTEPQRMLSLLISTFEAARNKNQELILAEESLQQLNEELEELISERTTEVANALQLNKSLLENAGEGIYGLDDNGKAIFVNQTALNMLGFAKEDLIGKEMHENHHHHKSDGSKYPKNECKINSSYQNGLTHKIANEVFWRKDGTSFPVEYTSTPIYKEGKLNGAVVVFNDISERKKAEEKILIERNKARQYFETAGVVMIVLNSKGNILQINQRGCEVLGYSKNEIIGKNWIDNFIPEIQRIEIKEFFEKSITGKVKSIESYENFIVNKKGELRLIAWNNKLLKNDKQKIIGALSSGEDITDKKKAEEVIKNANRVYAVLSNINQTIVRIKNKQSLFDEVCRIAVEDGKFRMAWIGIVDENSNIVEPVASAGVMGDYLKTINIDLNNERQKLGPTGQAVNSGVHYLANDIGNNPEMDNWREKALKNGYNASAAFPVTVFGKIVGAINLYAKEKFFFNKAEVKLLDELAMDISHAIEFIETEAKRKLAEQKIKQSEARYRKLVDSSPMGIVVHTDGIPQFANMMARKIMGFNGQDISKINFFEFVHPEYIDKVFKSIQETEETGQAHALIEVKLDTFDGRELFIEITSTPLVYEGKNAFQSMFNDITERKKTEGEIEELTIRLQHIIKSSNDWIWEIDIEGKYCYASENVEKMLGYTPDEVIGKLPFDLMPPSEKEWHLSYFLNLMEEKGSIIDLENWNIHKNGTPVCLLTNGFPIIDENGNLTGYRGVDKDITERKLAEKEILESEEKYRKLVDEINDGFYITDKQGIITFSNKALAGIFGFNNYTEIIGRNFLEFIPRDTKAQIKAKYRNAFETGGTSEGIEIKAIRIDGETVYIDITSVLIKENEKIIGLRGIVRDISKRKRSEQIQKVLYNISNAVNSTDNLKNMLKIAQREIGTIIDTSNFFVALYDKKTDTFSLPLFSDEKDKFKNIPAKKTLSKYVLESKQPLLANIDLKKKLVKEGKIENIGTLSKIWLGVPINAGGNVIGVIVVQDYNNEFAFGKSDMELLKFISDQISTSIQRKRAEEEIKELNASLEIKVKQRTKQLAGANNNLKEQLVETKRLSNELEVKNAEMQTQNEQLLQIQLHLDETRKKYFDLYNLAPVGYLTISEYGLIIEANIMAANLLGSEMEKLKNKPFIKFIINEDRDVFYQHKKQLNETFEKQSCEMRMKRENGTQFWAHLEGILNQMPNGKKNCSITISNISKRKQAENEIEKARNEADRANKEKSEFLSRMSHELRTPMNSILGFAQLLNLGELNPPQKRGVDHILKSGKHLLGLINEVLDLSRIEAGKLSLSLEPMALF
ncbi:MAG: PAS domain S-box protein [Prolixibacteraceae bacterium]|jgi:PAS domain S-box-containing protein|nr:PAS domain S-box protein [Prolixibacteraceae bacterium]MBT7393829.1 PAS domain S-box protein [Prolixibacteraceae bacterium]